MKNYWQIRKLGDVCEIINGGTPRTSVPEYWSGKYLWITPAEMGKRSSPFVNETERKLSDLGLKDSSAQLLPPNSVILSSRAPIGYLAINTVPMATNQGCKGLVPRNGLDAKFLYYYLGNIVDVLNALGTGATFKEISGGKLKEVSIPVPPLGEQKQTVKVLDDVFNKTAKAKENAEKNLKNARELFDSYLQKIFANPGDGWTKTYLSEICEIRPSKSEARAKLRDYDIVSFVPMEDLGIKQKWVVPVKERKLKEVEGSYTYFANQDVLLAKITPCFENGKLGIAHDLKNGIGFGSSEFVVFRTKAKLSPEFLYYYLLREGFREEGSKRMMGAVGHKRVAKEFLENSVIFVPPPAIQERLIANLDLLSSEIKKLESIYQQKLFDLEELKKSVLHKAFNGELAGARS